MVCFVNIVNFLERLQQFLHDNEQVLANYDRLNDLARRNNLDHLLKLICHSLENTGFVSLQRDHPDVV